MLAYCPNCLNTLKDAEDFSCRRCGTAKPPSGVWPKDIYLGEIVDNGKYVVERLLGSGGFGKVYEVRHTLLEDQTFAMKVLNTSMAGDPSSEAEFLQEVRILMGLNHPNIVTCHDVGRLPNGALFLRMELVDGQGVHSVIYPPHMLLSARRAMEIGRQVASALAAAHARGILHRDLKPANILLLKGDDVRVIDFGIAKVLDGQDQNLSRVIGTPDYMAPEQFTPGAIVDGRLDIYQLGAVLHYLMTGQPPYWSKGVNTTQRALLVTAKGQEERRDGFGPRPSEKRPEIAEESPGIDTLIARMLSTEASRRPDAKETIKLFEALLSGAQNPAATPENTPSTDEALMRHESGPTMLAVGKAPLVDKPTDEAAPTKLLTQRLTPTGERSFKRTTSPFEKRVAILPIANGGKPDDAYLAEGLTEDLTDTLSMVPALRVRPRGVVSALDDAILGDPKKAGETLDVAWVIEGSLRRMGERIQIRVRLISVSEGFQKWAKRFRCTTDEIFDVSDEIAEAISEALSGEGLGEAKKAGPNAAAADLYLRARYELRRTWHGNTDQAVALFDQALAASPNDPLIMSMSAVARARLAYKGGADHLGQVEVARGLAEKALAIAPERCEPYYALGLVHYLSDNLDLAVQALYVALERSDAYPEAHDLLGRLLLDRGPIKEAVRQLRQALTLDPGMFNARFDLARGFALLGEWDRARTMLVTDEDHGIDAALSRLLRVRFALWRRAPLDEDAVEPPTPKDDISHMTALLCDVRRTGSLADTQRDWLKGRADNAATALRKTLFYQYLAETAAYSGQRDACIHALEVAVLTGLSDIVWLHRCPLFDILADDARLIALRNRHPERR